VAERSARPGAFVPGRVYCYRCEGNSCLHAAPPDPVSVFAGYSSTGQPEWAELGQVLLELRHPRVDLLFQEGGLHLAAAAVEGTRLTSRQLEVFGQGSATYRIQGQVVAGFFRPTLPDGTRPRVAMTLQAVEVRDGRGHSRLVLNVLSRLADGTSPLEWFEDPRHRRVSAILAKVRMRLQLSQGGAPEPVERVLRETVRALERIDRQVGRRTGHAEERGMVRRPTAKAWEDAAGQAGTLLRDERQGTVVVLGPRNRVHVFSPAGRHVTSLTMTTEEIRGRLRRRRWQPLDPREETRFRRILVEDGGEERGTATTGRAGQPVAATGKEER
jgi:hypothetical protein